MLHGKSKFLSTLRLHKIPCIQREKWTDRDNLEYLLNYINHTHEVPIFLWQVKIFNMPILLDDLTKGMHAILILVLLIFEIIQYQTYNHSINNIAYRMLSWIAVKSKYNTANVPATFIASFKLLINRGKSPEVRKVE